MIRLLSHDAIPVSPALSSASCIVKCNLAIARIAGEHGAALGARIAFGILVSSCIIYGLISKSRALPTDVARRLARGLRLSRPERWKL